MFREFGAFLLLFALLAALVHESEIVYILAAAACVFFSVGLVSDKFAKLWHSKPRRQQTL